MAAAGEEQRIQQHGDDGSLSANQLRVRAEARQRRLLLCRASRRLQVLGGCFPEDAGMRAARSVEHSAANGEGQELHPVSRVNYCATPSGDGSASRDREMRTEVRREVISPQLPQHAEGERCGVLGRSSSTAQHPGCPTAQCVPGGAAANRLHLKPTPGLERGTCLREEPDGSPFHRNGNYRGKTTQPPARCPAFTQTLASRAKSTKKIPAVSKYLASAVLGSIRRGLRKLLTGALTALHANLVLLRRLHIFAFVAAAIISAVLPRAVLLEDLTSTPAPIPGNTTLLAIVDRRIRCFLRYFIFCCASQPLLCVLCATCGLLLVEHAPTLVNQASREGKDFKVTELHDSHTSSLQKVQHSAGELLQHHNSSGSPAAPGLRPVVCSNSSHENNRVEGTQSMGIKSRLNMLHTLLSSFFFLLQCYATLVRLLQQLAIFVVLHCIFRIGLVQIAVFAGCK